MTTEIRFFALRSKKEKVLDNRCQNKNVETLLFLTFSVLVAKVGYIIQIYNGENQHEYLLRTYSKYAALKNHLVV